MLKNDSDIKKIAQDLISKDKDIREKSALSILFDIRKKVEDIGDLPNIISLYCSACLLPIQNGDLAYCMNCCNSVCHISCLTKISEFDLSTMEHQCPNCSQVLSTELMQKLTKMQKVINNIHNKT